MAETGAHLTNRRNRRRVAQDAEVLEQEGFAEDIAFGAGVTVAGDVTVVGDVSIGNLLRLGSLETPTISSGVLTVSSTFVNPLPESSTSDTVDSIVVSGATEAAGDVLVIHVPATNTITFDDAVINLGAATRAVAPGGTLMLVYDGSQWSEMFFTAATDNA